MRSFYREEHSVWHGDESLDTNDGEAWKFLSPSGALRRWLIQPGAVMDWCTASGNMALTRFAAVRTDGKLWTLFVFPDAIDSTRERQQPIYLLCDQPNGNDVLTLGFYHQARAYSEARVGGQEAELPVAEDWPEDALKALAELRQHLANGDAVAFGLPSDVLADDGYKQVAQLGKNSRWAVQAVTATHTTAHVLSPPISTTKSPSLRPDNSERKQSRADAVQPVVKSTSPEGARMLKQSAPQQAEPSLVQSRNPAEPENKAVATIVDPENTTKGVDMTMRIVSAFGVLLLLFQIALLVGQWNLSQEIGLIAEPADISQDQDQAEASNGASKEVSDQVNGLRNQISKLEKLLRNPGNENASLAELVIEMKNTVGEDDTEGLRGALKELRKDIAAVKEPAEQKTAAAIDSARDLKAASETLMDRLEHVSKTLGSVPASDGNQVTSSSVASLIEKLDRINKLLGNARGEGGQGDEGTLRLVANLRSEIDALRKQITAEPAIGATDRQSQSLSTDLSKLKEQVSELATALSEINGIQGNAGSLPGRVSELKKAIAVMNKDGKQLLIDLARKLQQAAEVWPDPN